MLPFDTTLANFGAIASIVCLVLAVVAAMPGVRPRIRRLVSGSSIVNKPTSQANRVSTAVPTLVTFPLASPNPSLRLQQMLESAKSVNSSYDRSEALRLVAEHAVSHGAYEEAIKAGEADSSNYAKSETLKFVAISAALRGSFKEAARAAKNIPSVYTQGETTKKILEIQSKLGKGHLDRH